LKIVASDVKALAYFGSVSPTILKGLLITFDAPPLIFTIENRIGETKKQGQFFSYVSCYNSPAFQG